MTGELNRVIEQVSKEKGIDKTIVISAVEEMHSAARRTFGNERNIVSRATTRSSARSSCSKSRRWSTRSPTRKPRPRSTRRAPSTIPRPRSATKS